MMPKGGDYGDRAVSPKKHMPDRGDPVTVALSLLYLCYGLCQLRLYQPPLHNLYRTMNGPRRLPALAIHHPGGWIPATTPVPA